MSYSERKLKIEYHLARTVVLVIGVVAAFGVSRHLRDNGIEHSGAWATGLVFIPALWVFQTLRIHFIFAKHGLGLDDQNPF